MVKICTLNNTHTKLTVIAKQYKAPEEEVPLTSLVKDVRDNDVQALCRPLYSAHEIPTFTLKGDSTYQCLMRKTLQVGSYFQC